MPVSTYLSILRHRWLLVLTPAIIASVISLGMAFIEPPRYRSSASLLITRSEDRRFDTEDALAYDLPAIIKGAPFSIEISSALARTGVSFRQNRCARRWEHQTGGVWCRYGRKLATRRCRKH